MMHIVLMHNPSAGGQDHDAADLVRRIEGVGHHVVACVESRRALTEALRSPCDLVVVAGGDGTVNKAASILAGTGVPLTVLPFGTANNIARTLRLDAPVGERIAGWSSDAVRAFDVAHATAEGETRCFFEALGFGAFPRLMHREVEPEEPIEPDDKLARDLKLLRKHVAQSPLKRYEIVADGEDLSGAYLMIEVLNIPFIGPSLPLAPGACPSDGRLDLVLVGEAERPLVLAALDRMRDGEEAALILPTRHVGRVVVEGSLRRYHRDGDLCEGPAKTMDVRVEAGGVRVLAPQ